MINPLKVIACCQIINTIKGQLLDSEHGETVLDKIRQLIAGSNLKTDDVKNLTVAALLMKLIKSSNSEKDQSMLAELLAMSKRFGIDTTNAGELGLG